MKEPYKTDKDAMEFRKTMHVDHYTLAYRLANRKLTAVAGAIYYIIRYWPLSLWAVAIGDNLHCRAGIAAVLIVLACAAINILWHGYSCTRTIVLSQGFFRQFCRMPDIIVEYITI